MDFKRLLTSVFGLGWLPKAPGTWGSIPAVILFALVCSHVGTSISILIAMGATVLLGSFVCVKFSPSVIRQTGLKDPGEIVADETAGQAITFLAAFTVTVVFVQLIRVFTRKPINFKNKTNK